MSQRPALLAGSIDLLSEWRSGRAISGVIAGGVNAFLDVNVSVAFAMMIWAGSLASFAAAGVGMTLFCGAMMAFIALSSSIRGTNALPQDTPTAILALVAAAIAQELAGAPPAQLFATVAAAIALSTVLIGVFFYVLGRLNLATLVRFIPFPVVGGFLAGVGWLLVQGAFTVLSQQPLQLTDLGPLLTADTVAKWAPGVVFCVALVLVLKRFEHYLVLPGMLLGGCVLFFVFVPLSGWSFSELMNEGWMLGPFPEDGLWQPFAYASFDMIQWSALASQWPGIATLVAVGTMDMLLNASGIELATREDYDLNQEMRSAGVTNVACGVLGGQCGWHAGSTTVLAHRIAGPMRTSGVTAGILCALVLLAGTSVIEYMPRWVLGGLLMYIGVEFLREWIVEGWRRMPRADYAIVVLILLTIGGAGFLAGIALGLAAGIGLFVVNYSRMDVVKHNMSGAVLTSNVYRFEPDADLLRRHGEKIQVLKLQGFLFFGTANKLLTRIVERVEDDNAPALAFMVLDFDLVTGIDSSAATSFVKLRRLSEKAGFSIVMTSLSPTLREQLAVVIESSEGEEPLHVCPDLDHGIEYCEEALLTDLKGTTDSQDESLQAFFEKKLECADAARLFDHYFVSRAMKKGTVLVRQGEDSDDLFFIESGQATVMLERHDGTTVRVRKLRHGSVLGELGFYLREPRVASVVIDKTSVVYQLRRSALERMERDDPDLAFSFHRYIIEVLSLRFTHNVKIVSLLMRQ